MTVAGDTSQTEVVENELDAFATVTLKRVATDDVGRIVVRVVGRVERAGLVLSAVDRPTAVF